MSYDHADLSETDDDEDFFLTCGGKKISVGVGQHVRIVNQ